MSTSCCNHIHTSDTNTYILWHKGAWKRHEDPDLREVIQHQKKGSPGWELCLTLCVSLNICSLSVEWNEVCAGTPLIRGSMRQAEEGQGWGLEGRRSPWKLLHLLVNPRTAPPSAVDGRQTRVKDCNLTGDTQCVIFFSDAEWRCYASGYRDGEYQSTCVHSLQEHTISSIRGDKCTWQDALEHADSSDSQ